jgi:predicted RNA-binding protein with TRAM domain
MAFQMKNFLLLLLLACSSAWAQSSDDSYTRYELLDPPSQSFRIIYDVTATTAGAEFYYNTLRKGSEHKVDNVIDLMTGKSLEWKIVSGAEAKRGGNMQASDDVDYLQVRLARPIAEGNEYRIRIDKTYKDSKSYFTKDDRIIFDRPLGIKRNAVILPKGYEVVRCNYPVQVILESDGRIKLSFIHTVPGELPLHVEGRKLPTSSDLVVATEKPAPFIQGVGRDKSKARTDWTFLEKANQSREIVYFLQQPETHAFRLYHDYTETKEGMDRYINIVRTGSKASDASAKILDTGKDLKVETLKGEAITKKGLDIGEIVSPETEVVVIWFEPVQKGQSVRLRIEETYEDVSRYMLHKNELVFDRSFGRSFNTVNLPNGWFLTANAIPATVNLTPDNKVSLYYVNDKPDDIGVLIRARRR